MKFPKDNLPHKAVIEWWYFNGNLSDKKGNKYAFMDCLFKTDPKKTNIPLVEKIPAKEVYFSHSVFSDISRNRAKVRMHPLSILSEDSLKSKTLFINYLNPSPFEYVNNEMIELKNGFKIRNEEIDLFLRIRKKPFLHNGNGIFNVNDKKVFYYSFTDLEAKGTITVKEKPVKVEGKAWMDHEWASFSGKKNWNWFSIQLDNNVELMIQDYNNGENVYAGINGRNPEFVHNVDLIPKKFWKSTLTGAEYPIEWEIFLPSKNILLNIKAPIKNQEVLFGSMNYWEGPIVISGKWNGKNVKGKGFMELTGREMHKSKISIYESELKKEAQKYISLAKKEARHYFKH